MGVSAIFENELKRTHRILTLKVISSLNFALCLATIEVLASNNGDSNSHYDQCSCFVVDSGQEDIETKLVIGDMRWIVVAAREKRESSWEAGSQRSAFRFFRSLCVSVPLRHCSFRPVFCINPGQP